MDAFSRREMARQMQSPGLRYTTALMQLQDPKHTKVIIVTLAETTPVLEAANLQSDLNRADIHPWAWVMQQQHRGGRLARLRYVALAASAGAQRTTKH
jgi:arsenite-transporting ATPase